MTKTKSPLAIRLLRNMFALSAVFCASLLLLWAAGDRTVSQPGTAPLADFDLQEQNVSWQLEQLEPVRNETTSGIRAVWF